MKAIAPIKVTHGELYTPGLQAEDAKGQSHFINHPSFVKTANACDLLFQSLSAEATTSPHAHALISLLFLDVF